MAWRIEGYDSIELIFERDVPGNLSESEVLAMLQRLAARHLSPDEIVSASLRRGAKNRSELLDPIGRKDSLHVGQNPYYIATWRD